ncbi:MFS transporter permease [Bowmanella dokdonensis]|uniref:MFS transporter permease n=2 Tax=Bowmanella dokdonensis TaxID=751969 RepID=A0A939DPU3_9ALTE|nr:MFS transporter permease [Bowmanella dokdonensis]
MLSIFLFGIASGFPWVMIGSVMSAWLKDAGLTRSAIGFFTAVFAVYSINFLWSPLVDRLKLPLLTARLGQRRGWILLTQLLICLGCLALARLDPNSALWLAGLSALGIALASATQDIVIDAYRIDSIDPVHNEQQSTGAAMATSGWWTGYAGLGAIPFFVADVPGWHWPDIYLLLAALMLLLTGGIWVATEPQTRIREQTYQQAESRYLAAVSSHGPAATLVLLAILSAITLCGFQVFAPTWFAYQNAAVSLLVLLLVAFAVRTTSRMLKEQAAQNKLTANSTQKAMAWLLVSLGEPLRDFFSRNGVRVALTLLLFVMLFKMGEAVLGRMSIVFYKEIGFSNADIGAYSKLLTWVVTIVASVTGSLINLRIGIIKGLYVGGLAMAASNLLFALMASVGPDKTLLFVTIVVDGFTAAWGTVAFMAFISVLCNRAFTASQYALLASIGTFGRTTLGAYSGVVVDYLDGNWQLFFLLTALMVLPSLLLLTLIRHKVREIAGERA